MRGSVEGSAYWDLACYAVSVCNARPDLKSQSMHLGICCTVQLGRHDLMSLARAGQVEAQNTGIWTQLTTSCFIFLHLVACEPANLRTMAPSPKSIFTYSEKGSEGGRSPRSDAGDGLCISHTHITHKSESSNESGGSRGPFWSKRQNGRKEPKLNQAGLNEQQLAATAAEEDKRLNKGWPLLARLMDKQPELESFGRFRELNVKNLLYYQVELEFLRKALEDEEVRDASGSHDDPDRVFHRDANVMMDRDLVTMKLEDPKSAQWATVLELRRCLRDYNEALLQYAQVSALPDANRRDVGELVNWIRMPDRGNFSITSYGSEVWGNLFGDPKGNLSFAELFSQAWEGFLSRGMFWRPRPPRTRSDLVAPRPGVKIDAVAGWIAYTLIPWMSCFAARVAEMVGNMRAFSKRTSDAEAGPRTRPKKPLVCALQSTNSTTHSLTYSYVHQDDIIPIPVAAVNKVTSLIATVVACVLPTVAIGVLTTTTSTDSTLHKLLWIGSFTILFALGLTAFTNEVSRVQIFMAAAAYVYPLINGFRLERFALTKTRIRFSAIMVVFIHE
jgi:hypothetical protein